MRSLRLFPTLFCTNRSGSSLRFDRILIYWSKWSSTMRLFFAQGRLIRTHSLASRRTWTFESRVQPSMILRAFFGFSAINGRIANSPVKRFVSSWRNAIDRSKFSVPCFSIYRQIGQSHHPVWNIPSVVISSSQRICENISRTVSYFSGRHRSNASTKTSCLARKFRGSSRPLRNRRKSSLGNVGKTWSIFSAIRFTHSVP